MKANMEDAYYDKIFRAGDSELSRGELESLPCPFCTDNVSDDTMQKIVEIIDSSTRDRLRIGPDDHIDFENDFHSRIWWEEMEAVVCEFDIPYYEDLETE